MVLSLNVLPPACVDVVGSGESLVTLLPLIFTHGVL